MSNNRRYDPGIGREECSTVLLLFSVLLHRPFRNILGRDAIYRLGCWNILIIRNAFLEAFQALCDITHHIGKASFPEQQHYYNTDHQPVPDAKATPFNSPRVGTYLDVFVTIFQRRSLSEEIKLQIDRINKSSGFPILYYGEVTTDPQNTT